MNSSRGRRRTSWGAAVALALSCSAIAGSGVAQQTGGLRVIADHPISPDSSSRPYFETHLAVNPADPRHLLATSMTLLPNGDNGVALLVSFDGGRHWTPGRLPPAGTPMFRLDPVVYFTRAGTALFVAGGRDAGDRPVSLISRSIDGGRTWTAPQRLAYRDRSWLAFDTTGQALDGTIYFAGVNGAYLLSRSTDDGRSFSWPDLITRDREGPDPWLPISGGGLADLQVMPDGRLLLPFLAGEHLGDSMPRADSVAVLRFRLLVSDDGGRTFAPVRDGPKMRSLLGYRGIRAITAPRTALDQSRGAHRGRLYLAYTDYEAGRYRVKVTSTHDLGKTWKTTTVTDDTTGHDPSNTAVAVNRDGIVAVVWNDRRDDPRGDCFRLYGAISTDGGEKFLPNVRLSEAPVCPNSSANWQLTTWYQYDDWSDPDRPRPGLGLTALVPVRFPNGGDTHGLVADRDGVFHAAYVDGRRGRMDLWLVDFAPDSSVVAAVRNAHAATTPANRALPADWDDATQELELVVDRPAIDFTAGALTLRLQVVNRAGRAVRGPITLVVDELLDARSKAMGLRNFRVANADSGGTGDGASWVFTVSGDAVIARGERSQARTLRFEFEGGVPAEPEGYFEPKFRIYGRR